MSQSPFHCGVDEREVQATIKNVKAVLSACLNAVQAHP
jgi:copper chaperone CopZ